MAAGTVGPGTVVATRYLVEDLISDHAGAKAWRATDSVLARSVAVQVLPVSDSRAADLLAAARSSARVLDGRFLRVLDASQEDSNVFVVREWAFGNSLDLLLAERPLPPRRAAWVVGQVAEAIATAHRAGICHSQLTPHNVVITDNGSVKVIGLAIKAALEPSGSSDPQADDVRDLGRLLYACLVGRWPDGPLAGMSAAPTEHGKVLRPRQVRAGVPKPLDDVCDRILSEPGRYNPQPLTTAAQVAAALTSVVVDMPDAPIGADLGAAPGLLAALTSPSAAAIAANGAGSPGADPAGQTAPPMPTPRRTPVNGRSVAPAATDPGGWGRALLWVALAVLVAGAALLAFELGRSDFGSDPSTPSRSQSAAGTTPPGPVHIAAVSSFDPVVNGGSGAENPDEVPLATDGDPSTSWTTKTYFNSPQLGNEKPGVGLLVDLGEVRAVTSVDLTLLGSGTDVELRAAPEAQTSPPELLAGLRVVASASDAGTQATLTPDSPVTTRFLLFYLTKLPPDGKGSYKGGIAELKVDG
ncbi:MAG: protein kinase family protein [Nocardioidaceae bacterium]